jgi:hypothetical protein
MKVEIGYGIILFRDREFALVNTSKPALAHHPSAYVVGR